MAHLAIVVSHCVNGVAKMHTEIVKHIVCFNLILSIDCPSYILHRLLQISTLSGQRSSRTRLMESPQEGKQRETYK